MEYDAAVYTAGDAQLQRKQKSTFDELNFFPEVPESNKATEMLLASADRRYFGNKIYVHTILVNILRYVRLNIKNENNFL